MTDTVTPSQAAGQAAAGPGAGRGVGGHRAAAQDAEFTAFVMSAGTRLRRNAYLMCRDWHLAQDLTQHTFAKMYSVWPRVRTGTNLEAYSRRVLMNLIANHYERRSGSEIVLAELPDHRSETSGMPELRLALVDALARLSVEDRAVVVLRHMEDHSVETVAGILRVSVSVVKMRNSRALARLRTMLGSDFLEG